MAAPQRQIKFSLLVSLLFFASTSPISFEKVSLDLYYESLCPSSAEFVVNNLAKIFENGIIDIVDLTLYPWGNAKLRGNSSFTCQHGPAECLLNTIEACAIDAWPDVKEHFPFIYCIESLFYNGEYTEWETCYEKSSKDPKPVFDCFFTERGKELELSYAAATNALEPPHKYVPWVVVDGQPLYEDYDNLFRYICKAYKGTAEIAICNEFLDQDGGMIRFVTSPLVSVAKSLANRAKQLIFSA